MRSFQHLASAALVFAGLAAASDASASAVVTTRCVSVLDSAGCLFNGNINGNGSASNVNSYLYAQNAYNLFNDTHPTANPDIALSYLGDTNAGFPGSFTGAGTSSGTWTLSGYTVNFIAVKASRQFVLYKIAAASSGTWTTMNIPYRNNPANVSHLVFFGTKSTTPAVPEPATWLTMIIGFAAVGAAMRRRMSDPAHSGALPAQ